MNKKVMENRGKQTCKILKDIRRQIAKDNNIDLVIQECTFKGECAGTCPRCEAEVAYLEKELVRRKAMGKAVTIAGLTVGSLAMVSCGGYQIAGEEPLIQGIDPDPYYGEDSTSICDNPQEVAPSEDTFELQ